MTTTEELAEGVVRAAKDAIASRLAPIAVRVDALELKATEPVGPAQVQAEVAVRSMPLPPGWIGECQRDPLTGAWVSFALRPVQLGEARRDEIAELQAQVAELQAQVAQLIGQRSARPRKGAQAALPLFEGAH